MQDEGYIVIPLHGRDRKIRAYAKVSDRDAHLARMRWCFDGRYAKRRNGARLEYLHRVIFGLGPGSEIEVDHINRDKLDCQRANLRLVTHAQNQQNMPSVSGSSSQYRGVHWCSTINKWIARVNHEGKCHVLGRFDDEHEAGAAARAFRESNMPFTVEV